LLNFIDHKGLQVQAMALDCRTILGPYVPVANVDTLRRMLAYLGATPGADDADRTRGLSEASRRGALTPAAVRPIEVFELAAIIRFRLADDCQATTTQPAIKGNTHKRNTAIATMSSPLGPTVHEHAADHIRFS
jgi:hypothetical protein